MDLGKLTKRLRRELLANPKQATALAVVCVVALWFWWPLLQKWFGGKPRTAAAAAAPAASAAAGANDVKEEKRRSWLEVRAWRVADPLTRPASLIEEARDPFQSLQPQTIANKSEEQEQVGESTEVVADEQPIEPEKLGIVLEAIVYGDSRRRAQINGQTVKENDQVTLSGKDEESELVAHVVAIRQDEVVLDIRGVSWRLKLQPKLLGRGEVVETTKSITQGSP